MWIQKLLYGKLGVNREHGETEGAIPPEFGVEDANANCLPPDFVMFQNFKHQIACITIQ